jgi:4-hydroxy-tetrahydrodipicolinate synthase
LSLVYILAASAAADAIDEAPNAVGRIGATRNSERNKHYQLHLAPKEQKMFTGCGTALVTPFRQNLSLDEPALRRLIRRQINAGIDFLVPCGTTGENPTLTRAEHLRVVEITVEESNGQVPVLAGAGGYNTAEVIELARDLESLRADGILSVTPYYNKPTQEGLYQHFKAIAAAIAIPIIVYSVQGRTGVNVEPATLKRLAQIDNIAGVKEASGNIGQIATIVSQARDGFSVLSGDDAIALPVIALGAHGVISVVANEIPAEMASLIHACLEGDFARARELQKNYLPLMEINFIESNPGPAKAAMAEMGLLEPVWRLPLVPPRIENLEKIRHVLESIGLVGKVHAAATN